MPSKEEKGESMGNFLDELKKVGLTDSKKQKQLEREMRKQAHIDLKQKAKESSPVLQPDPIAKLEKQRTERLSQLMDEGCVEDYAGRKRFYFQTPDQSIAYLQLSDIAAALLERGKFAITLGSDPDSYLLIRRAQALAMEELDSRMIVFLQRKEN